MKSYILFLIALGMAPLTLTSCILEPPQPDSILYGRALEKEGQYLHAQTYYENMRNETVRDVSLHNLDHLYGDIIAAMQARQDAPNSPEAYYKLGRAYYEKMLSIPGMASEIAPNVNFETAPYFAEQRQQLQQQAQPPLEAATKLQAQYPDALSLQAKVYEAGDTPELAIPIYQDMIATQQATAETYYRLAALLFNQGDIEQALDHARESVNLFPDDATAHLVLGKLCAVEDIRAEAIEAFQHSLCLNPYNPESFYHLSQVYLTDGNTIDAERVLRLGVVNNPEANRIKLLFTSLQEIMDEKQMNEFMDIYDSAVEDIVAIMATYALTGKDAEPNPMIEIRYFQLLIRYLERQRPYTPPCSGEDSHPFFDHQIRAFQDKIRENEKLLAEAEAAQTAEETPPEK